MKLWLNVTTEDGELLVREEIEVDDSQPVSMAFRAFSSRSVASDVESAVRMVLARKEKREDG